MFDFMSMTLLGQFSVDPQPPGDKKFKMTTFLFSHFLCIAFSYQVSFLFIWTKFSLMEEKPLL